MAYGPNSDEQHLLELVCLLPDEDDERFWKRVSQLSDCAGSSQDLNAALRNAVSHGRCLTLADTVLGIFGPLEHRDKMARMIGARQLTTTSHVDRRGVGEQWIQDAVSTAWRIRFSYSRPQGENPLEVLKRKWLLE